MYFCFIIVVTGSAGFIGSCLIKDLNKLGIIDLVLVDDFSSLEKKKNINNIKYFKKINRDKFIYWFSDNAQKIEFVYHIGARTDTAEVNIDIFNNLNLNYSKSLFLICTKYDIPFVYASSAATYGNSFDCYDDENSFDNFLKLKPINYYGYTKAEADKQIISSGCKYVIIRSSWIYSDHGKNFLNTIINLSKKDLIIVYLGVQEAVDIKFSLAIYKRIIILLLKISCLL